MALPLSHTPHFLIILLTFYVQYRDKVPPSVLLLGKGAGAWISSFIIDGSQLG